MAAPHELAEIARRYGFQSFAQLLEASEALPRADEEEARVFLARRADGRWFLWEDRLPESPPPEFEDH